MQYSKAMIELVLEIRRKAHTEIKSSIKLTNPKLFEDLKALYFGNCSIVIQALIKELFRLAGSEHYHQLRYPRGQSPLSDENASKVRQRIYRGRVVNA